MTHDLIIGLVLNYEGVIIIQTDNMGKLQNKGWEFLVKAKPVISSTFNWNTNFNMSFNKNQLLFDIYSQYTGSIRISYPELSPV